MKTKTKTKMKKLLIITADTNDGDYVDRIQYITDKEINIIKELVALLKTCPDGKHYNWVDSEHGDEEKHPLKMYKLSDEKFEEYSDYIPSGEYGIHTIESIRILNVEDDVELLGK